MKIRSFYFIVFLFIIIAHSSSLAQIRRTNYDLPFGDVSGRRLCGFAWCDCGPSRVGVPYNFAARLYSPPVEDASTPTTIALSVLGYIVDAGKTDESEYPKPCSETALASDFTAADIDFNGYPNGLDIHYTTTRRVDIDASLTAKANVLELIGLKTVPDEFIKDIEAELEALYKKLDDKTVDLTTTYYNVSLKPTTTRKIETQQQYAECRKIMKDKNKSVIIAAGILSYDIKYNRDELSKLTAGIKAKLNARGLGANLNAIVKREVTKKIEGQVSNGYQILSWRKLSF
jgi:hypothetical protein